MLSIHHFAPDGSESEVAPGDLAARIREEGTVWIDLAEPSDEEFAEVADTFKWHPLAIEDCRVETHLPKVDDYGGYLLMVLHGFDVDAESHEFQSKEIEIFLGANYLVTHHASALAAPQKLIDRCRSNPALAAKGPAYLLYLLLELMTNVYLPYLDGLDEKIDRVEDALLGRPTRETLQEIYSLKRDVISLRRVAMPQLEVMRRLGRDDFEVIPASSRVYFRDIYDDLFRMTQATDSYRELLTEALNSYLSALSNEMNQVMKILTVFASIMLPLTFLAGIWGMNFLHMPELAWRAGYPFALGIMALTGLGLAWFFKRRRWW